MEPESGPDPHPVDGLVVSLQANYCWVELARPGPGGVGRMLCTRRTRLAKLGQAICVGDRVRLEGIDWAAARAAVAAVGVRSCLLPRPAVANVSRVVVVMALAEPDPDPLQLTRFLITAEATGRPVELVFSKADLPPAGQVEAWCERARRWGYAPVAVSAHADEGLEPLRQRLSRPGISVLCGPSGVGKSSLLNRLDPRLELRVAAVSGRLQRGRHTTRHVELFTLSPGALVADTPGFNRPELPGEPGELAALFPELRQRLSEGRCRFGDCLHQGEPGCAAAQPWDRRPLYDHCLDLIRASQRRGERPEGGLDPRLRQPSRRSRRQRTARESGEDLSPPSREGSGSGPR